MIIEKLCEMSCDNCSFSISSKQQFAKSIIENSTLVLDIDVFEENYLTKSISDIPNKIILKKASNKPINFGIFRASDIERIIYHIDFNDLLVPEKLEQIKLNFNLIITSGVFLRIYIFVKNKSDFIETMEILKDYNNCSINFYCDKYYNFNNYKQLNIHSVDKVKIEDLFDKTKCTHKIIKNFNILYDYKQKEKEELI